MRSLTFLLSILFFLPPALSATEDLAVCTAELDSFKDPVDVQELLHHLFVKFEMKDVQGKRLKFKAKEIILGSGVVEFIDPRLNGKVIDYMDSNCVRSKKNIFGYDVCQEVGGKEIADTLCKQMGLPGASEQNPTGEAETVSSTHEKTTYKFGSGQWSSLRLWSALTPRIYHTRLKKLSCRAF